MRTRFLLLAVLLFPSAAHAVRIRTFPPQPIHLGESVTIEIDMPVKPQYYGDAQYGTVNFERMDGHWIVVNGQATPTLMISGRPRDASEIILGPFTYRGPDGREVTVPAVRIPVAADLADGSRPVESLAALKKAGRIDVVITTSMRKPVVYEGEEAVVEWWAVGAYTGWEVRDSPVERPAVEGIDRAWIANPRTRNFDSLGGMLVKRELKGEYHLLAKTPGIYAVPSVFFEGQDQTRSYTFPGTIQPLSFRRTAPAVQFQVVPRPATARGPIGQFRLQCRAGTWRGGWPTIIAEASGTGRLDSAKAPRFVARPNLTVVVQPNVTSQPYLSGEMTRQWIYEVHREAGQIPPLALAYYDPDRNENVETRCDPPAIVRATEPGSNVAPAEEKKKTADAGGPVDRSLMNGFEAVGLAMVIGAGYALLRTILG